MTLRACQNLYELFQWVSLFEGGMTPQGHLTLLNKTLSPREIPSRLLSRLQSILRVTRDRVEVDDVFVNPPVVGFSPC